MLLFCFNLLKLVVIGAKLIAFLSKNENYCPLPAGSETISLSVAIYRFFIYKQFTRIQQIKRGTFEI